MQQTIHQYIENKLKRKLHPWKYDGTTGNSGYMWNGVLVSVEFIEQQYPLAEKPLLFNQLHKGENPDSTSLA